MKKLILATMLCLGLACANAGVGQLLYEWWQNDTTQPPGDFSDLAAVDAWIATQTTNTETVTWPDVPDAAGRDYWVGKVTGWLIPPVTGDYTFHVAADDHVRLWIGDDYRAGRDNLLAYHDGWTGYREWGVYPTQTSQPIMLTGLKAYSLELLWRDGTGGGHAQAGWEGPGLPAWTGGDENIPSGDAITDTLEGTNLGMGAVDPDPAHQPYDWTPDTPMVDPGVQTLSWTADNASSIVNWKVYLATDMAALDPNNPNVEPYLIGTVDASTTSIETPELADTSTYYWRVDGVIDEANVATGYVWRFYTLNYGPIITQQPEDVLVAPACEGTLSIVAGPRVEGQGGDIHYQWYKVADGGDVPVGTDSDSYTTGVEGQYYCVVSNDSGSVQSNTVDLTIGLHLVVSQDIGTPTAAGDAYFDEDTQQLVVSGDGHDIWDAADDFHFVYVELSGDVDIMARVDSMSGGSNDWRKFGVMIRDELTAGSRHAFAAATANQGARWQGRRDPDTSNNGNAAMAPGYPQTWNDGEPYWVRIRREAQTNEFYAYVSHDGVNWELMPENTSGGELILNPHVFEMTDPVYVGIAVTSHEGGVLTTARFSNVTLNGEDMLALPWKVANVTVNTDPATGWVDYDGDVVISWEYGAYTPCDATYEVYVTDDRALLSDPNVGEIDPIETTEQTVTLADAEYGFEHDQTWYYRVDVVSAAGGGKQAGQWMSFDTIKWLPEIITQPETSTVVAAPADVTLNCVAEALDDDAAALTGYTWYRVVGEKDTTPGSGDDEVIFTNNSPTELSRDGKRTYDCSVQLTIAGVGDEGLYYCVASNASGDAVSDNAQVLTQRLIIQYSFEGLNGNTVPDSSPSGFDGTLVSPLEWANETIIGGIEPGIIGNAIRLVGGEDPNAAYVDTGKTAFELGIEGARPRSVSVWVWTGDMGRSGVYSVGEYSSMHMFGAHNQNDPGNNYSYQFDHWGANFDLADMSVLGNWAHFVHVYDGANVRIYVNGVKVADYAADLNTPAGGQPFAVGFWGSYDASYQHGVFHGLIDEFALYNYALSPLEIGQLYIAGVGGTACVEAPQYDLSGDCGVDLEDVAIFAASWAESSIVSP